MEKDEIIKALTKAGLLIKGAKELEIRRGIDRWNLVELIHKITNEKDEK